MNKNKISKKILASIIACSTMTAGVFANDADITEKKITEVNSNISKKQLQLNEASQNIKKLEQELRPMRENIYTLAGQIDNIEKQTVLTEAKITNLKNQIAKKELEVGSMLEMQEYYETKLGREKNNLRKYASLLYSMETQYIDFETQEINPYKLLLANNSISDTTRDIEQLDFTSQITKNIITEIDHSQELVNIRETEANQARAELSALKKQIEGEKSNLQAQLEAKERLLNETEGKEEEYQKLLAETIQQEEDIKNDIKRLAVDNSYLKDKLVELNKARAQKNKIEGNPENNSDIRYEDLSDLEKNLAGKDSVLTWPVDPSRGITAYFHDEDYKSVFGMTHEAIDIRAYQNTPIQAPADAIVYKVKDNGMGYSYIILAHNNNILTVYGHVSEFAVEEGDIVMQGDVIGLSGGTPGTKGAGTMTTGAHLHFEVYENGIHKNPLEYLNVMALPAEYIPDKFLQNL